MQEGVQEVDGEEPQVGQPLQQALHAGVADLQHLAGVHHLTEADVHVVTVQTRIRSARAKDRRRLDAFKARIRRRCQSKRGSLDHLRDCDFGVVLESVHHQPIAADVVDALWDGFSRGDVSELCSCQHPLV